MLNLLLFCANINYILGASPEIGVDRLTLQEKALYSVDARDGNYVDPADHEYLHRKIEETNIDQYVESFISGDTRRRLQTETDSTSIADSVQCSFPILDVDDETSPWGMYFRFEAIAGGGIAVVALDVYNLRTQEIRTTVVALGGEVGIVINDDTKAEWQIGDHLVFQGRQFKNGCLDTFNIIFVADMESHYRGHTVAFCSNIISWIKDLVLVYDDDEFDDISIVPDLVIHGGDISDQKDGTWQKEEASDFEYENIWGQLYDAGIPMISALGNHDYNPFSDISNLDEVHEAANKFVLQSYQKSKALLGDAFGFEEFNDGTDVPSLFNSVFNGIQIVNLNHYDSVRNTQQLDALRQSLDYNKETIFFGHFPIRSVPEDILNEYKDLIGSFTRNQNKTIYLSGHAHGRMRRAYIYSGSYFEDYTAPYPHYRPLVPRSEFDATDKPGVYSVLVSRTDGVLHVEAIDIPYYEVSGCWANGTVCGVGTTCGQCCYTARNALGTQCGGEKWEDGTICGEGTTCNYCKNDATYWQSKLFPACGVEPCWADGTVCLVGTTCSKCCNTARTDLGTKCGGDPWRDGTVCALGTTCNYCRNPATHWDSKAITACGTEPCWSDGTICGVGTTCNKCCNTARTDLGTKCGGDPWRDGTICGLGTTCNYCGNPATYWPSKAFTACGREPCWGDGTYCGEGTTCNQCCNKSSWWWSKFFTACGSE